MLRCFLSDLKNTLDTLAFSTSPDLKVRTALHSMLFELDPKHLMSLSIADKPWNHFSRVNKSTIISSQSPVSFHTGRTISSRVPLRFYYKLFFIPSLKSFFLPGTFVLFLYFLEYTAKIENRKHIICPLTCWFIVMYFRNGIFVGQLYYTWK